MKQKITDVKGIGPSTAAVLAAHGIRTVKDLASATIAKLTGIPGFSEFRAGQVKFNAESLLKKAAPEGGSEVRTGSKAASAAKKAVNSPTAGPVKQKKKPDKDEKSKKAKKEAKKKDKEKDQLKKKAKSQEKSKDKSTKKVKKKK